MIRISRRNLAKTLSAGIVSATSSKNDIWASMVPTAIIPIGLRWESIYPGIWRASLGVSESVTPVRTRLMPVSEVELGKLPKRNEPPVSISGEVSSRGCHLYLPLNSHEYVYGFGLQLLSMESRGKKRVMRVNADPKMDTGDSHAPVPFYVTSKGYGVLVDTARAVEFSVGNARHKPTRAAPPGSSTVTDPLYTHNLVDTDAGEITVEVPKAKGVDVYLFAGPTMLQAVQRYNLFSGGGVAPPEWGLGFWYRGNGHSDQKRIVQLAREFRERKIPCDVLGLEPGWQSHAYSCTFVWDEHRFPEPEKLLGDLSSLQMKTNLWEHAYTHPSSPLFPELLPHSGNYGVWGGLVPDFVGEPARRAFGEYHAKNLIDKGVSGFKLDECDGSDYTGGWAFPNFSTFPSGCDGEQMHALFGLRYQHALLEQFNKRNRPTYGLVRSSGALAAPYPFVLYSDLYDHRQFIRGLVTSSFSGLLWCPEVRDAKTPSELIRRLQSVVFSPLAMINAWSIKNPPWKQIDRKLNNADSLTDNWENLEDRCREIIGWRMQLVPYLLAAFQKYSKDGTPPFRALALDYDTPELSRIDDQFLVGDRMMVAPLFEREPDRKVTLPPGTWQDFWSGKEFEGNTVLRVTEQERNIPVFVKSGSVIPIAQVTASTDDPDSKLLSVKVYGDGSLAWTNNGSTAFQISWDHGRRMGAIQGSSIYRITNWEQVGATLSGS